MQKSLDIHFNASYIVVELSDALTENEKAAIQCTMIAKQSFINESLNSFRHFLKCWDN